MKISFNKHFCLWLVSPGDGRVRKLRFSFLRAACLFSFAALIAGGFLYIAGDYARVQYLRAKNHFAVQALTTERDTLEDRNSTLETHVRKLESETTRVLRYEHSLKQRVEELSSVIKSAAELGVKVLVDVDIVLDSLPSEHVE